MARRFLLAAAAAVSFSLAAPLHLPPAWAAPTAGSEDTPITPEQAANSNNAAIGEINADNVYVRSAAGENYYQP